MDWKLFVPEGANIGSYYNQAINVDAPHPAAARLWQEFSVQPGGPEPVAARAAPIRCCRRR